MSFWTPPYLETSLLWSFNRIKTVDSQPSKDFIARQDYVTVNLHAFRPPQTELVRTEELLGCATVSMPNLSQDGRSLGFSSVFSDARSSPCRRELWNVWDICILEEVPYWGGRLGIDVALFADVGGNQVAHSLINSQKDRCWSVEGTTLSLYNSLPSKLLETLEPQPHTLEAAIRYKCCSPQTGIFLNLGIPYYAANFQELAFDANACSLENQNAEVRGSFGLLVEIQTSKVRRNWFNNETIQHAYHDLESSERDTEAIRSFRDIIMGLKDLLPHDLVKLCNLTEHECRQSTKSCRFRTLAELPLFDTAIENQLATN